MYSWNRYNGLALIIRNFSRVLSKQDNNYWIDWRYGVSIIPITEGAKAQSIDSGPISKLILIFKFKFVFDLPLILKQSNILIMIIIFYFQYFNSVPLCMYVIIAVWFDYIWFYEAFLSSLRSVSEGSFQSCALGKAQNSRK